MHADELGRRREQWFSCMGQRGQFRRQRQFQFWQWRRPSDGGIYPHRLHLDFEVTFSENVTNVGTNSFVLTRTSGSTAAGRVSAVSGGPQVYEVTVTLTGGAGDFRLDVP